MRLYFEFEDKRREATVTWPKTVGSIGVHLLDKELIRTFPPDLLFDLDDGNKITFTEESADNKRLISLQETIRRKLQESV